MTREKSQKRSWLGCHLSQFHSVISWSCMMHWSIIRWCVIFSNVVETTSSLSEIIFSLRFPLIPSRHGFIFLPSVVSAYGDGSNSSFKVETPIHLKPGNNEIAFLSMTVGLQVSFTLDLCYLQHLGTIHALSIINFLFPMGDTHRNGKHFNGLQ